MADIDLTSSAFLSGKTIPDRYTCSGENVSPPLAWNKIPEEAKSLVLIIDDPDAPSGLFTHWVLYNLPPDRNALPENYKPGQNVHVGRNSFGEAGYGGPCPPRGTTHHYYFRLFALDKILDVTAGATRSRIMDEIQGHILGQAEMIGLFGRR